MKNNRSFSKSFFCIFAAIAFTFVLFAEVEAQTPEDLWAIRVGNQWVYAGSDGFGTWTWIDTITGTDFVQGVPTYVMQGGEPAVEDMRWFSISPSEMRFLQVTFYDDIDLAWYSFTVNAPGLLWLRYPVVPGDSWPISVTGTAMVGSVPLGADIGTSPLTITGNVSVLNSTVSVPTPLGTYKAYQIDYNLNIFTLLGNDTIQERTWVVPYLGQIKWADLAFGETEVLSSVNIPSVLSDIPSSYWAFHYITGIYYDGITTGYTDGTYKPDLNVTRAEMAAFLVRARDGVNPTACSGTKFSDVPQGHFFCPYIERLSDLGITTGFQDGTFRPDALVDRQQMAAFIVRAVDGSNPTTCNAGMFVDVTEANFYCPYITRLAGLGVTTGFPDSTYHPGENVLRAQMAAFLARAFVGMP